jgi:pyrroline-5-carboxylate reductase
MKKHSALTGKKIGFIGVGNMGCALVNGLLRTKKVAGRNLILSDVAGEKLASFARLGAVVTLENKTVARDADILILAVKPQQMTSVFAEIVKELNKKTLIISIAAGVTTATIEKGLGRVAVVRSMPNMPALIGSGITAVAKGSRATDADIRTAREIFGAAGEVIIVEEKMMDAVTALSGSGPAYLCYFYECMIDAGLNLGFTMEKARELSHATILGTVRFLDQMKEVPEHLRRKVTSPGGTTEAAVTFLQENGFMNTFVSAVMKAKERAEELSRK